MVFTNEEVAMIEGIIGSFLQLTHWIPKIFTVFPMQLILR